MSNQTLNIIRKATESGDRPYNILTFDTHERYQSQLAKTGHNFYAFKYDGSKNWVDSYARKPANYYTFPQNSVVSSVNIDFILSQSKFGQFQMAHKISEFFRLPIVSLEHTLPIPSWPNDQLQQFRAMRGDFNVFISEYSARQWGINPYTVIKHSVDTELFKPVIKTITVPATDEYPEETRYEVDNSERLPVVLSVVNDFKNRDYVCNYGGWERLTKGLTTRLVGDSPDPSFSRPAENVDELVKSYQRASVFLNTSTISPVPTSLLEAMACGCAVVTTATCMIPEIIKNGVNGFISNDETELRDYLQQLLVDDKLAAQLGAAARQTILTDFSEEKFITDWNKMFKKAYGAKR